MKLKKILILMLAVSMALVNYAIADENLEATLHGNKLEIRWNAKGECVLTVYQNQWPISIARVDGASGGTVMDVAGRGEYSVRLKTQNGCFTATAVPSEMVSTVPTSVATTKPTEVSNITPTIQPTAKPTAAPTIVPTMMPTVKPTEVPSAVPSSPAENGQSLTSMAAEVIRQVNEERTKHGLEPLTVSAQLTSAACIRANEIAELFSHTRPDGSSWSTVSSAAMGENIAKGQSSADRVMAAWMSSEGHRANILRESFGSIGVCALKVNGVIHWVQLFGK